MGDIRRSQKTWEAAEKGERQKKFTTVSGEEVKALYTPLDLQKKDYLAALGYPGEYPFTRGVYPTMYRGRLWTMRQFSGFGSAEDSNRRYRMLLSQGQTGISVAFHMPTLMGYDSDHPMASGEVGKCGVAIDSVKDMGTLFNVIPLDRVTTSMTINGPASILLAMYIVTAEKQGVSPLKIGGTIQNDILKEYIAQKSWIFPPRPSLRIITDIFAFCTRHVPRWNTISISGYHIREAGSTAVQELAFTLADGIGYVQAGIEAELDVDEFAPRLSFFFNSHSDFFEEIAKFRAARRIWARVMKERFKAKNPDSWKLRFHTQTSGCTLTAQQPMNNVVRVALQGMAAVLGGTQSLHTNSLDETLSLPTEEAALLALRTQQVIAEESGAADTIDPLGGSYFVESLTNQMEEEALEYISKIDKMGGIIPAIEKGFPQKEIARAAYRFQMEVEREERVIVGMNRFQEEGRTKIPILKIPPEVEERQVKALKRLKKQRNSKTVKACLDRLLTTAKGQGNLMPPIIDAVRSYATLGEICDTLREAFGEYQEPPWF